MLDWLDWLDKVERVESSRVESSQVEFEPYELLQPAANWAAWQLDVCQVGRLVRRPGGPPRQMLK